MTTILYGPLKNPTGKLSRLIVLNDCNQDHEVRCGDTIRLEHALTKKNLHSEEIYQSLITNGQEVSAFGVGGDGD